MVTYHSTQRGFRGNMPFDNVRLAVVVILPDTISTENVTLVSYTHKCSQPPCMMLSKNAVFLEDAVL
jgi:hypothetical protein